VEARDVEGGVGGWAPAGGVELGMKSDEGEEGVVLFVEKGGEGG